ncbi:MAG TPA: mechanosensitive ion channel domain-containing protein [Gemmatimonadales bacterium]|nr:mechanosensitive ion channel domain-containing protein [Gemmatimonadales bacterium]
MVHRRVVLMSWWRRVPVIVFGAAVAWSGRAAAQDTASKRPAQAAESNAVQPTAPVVVDGVPLFSVRGSSSYPAEKRAAAIADSIVAVASDRRIPVESLTVRETPLGSVITAAGRPVFAVVDADAQLEGIPRTVLARTHLGSAAEAILRYRHDREPAVLWRNAARALAAILALVLGLWIGYRVLRSLRAILERRFRARVRDLRIRTFEVVRGEQIWRAVHAAVSGAAVLIALVAVYACVDYVLLRFPWTTGLGHDLLAMLLDPLAALGLGVLRFIPNLVILLFLVWLTRHVLRLVHLFFLRVADGTITLPGLEREWALPTDRILRLAIFAVAVAAAYPHIPGSGSEAFKGVAVLLGLVFSLGSPSVIGNLVAGQSLAFRRVFKVGDRVKIGEHIGEVTEIRLLATYLRSPKNEQIVVPNSVIINSDVVNYSTLAGDAGLILHSMVGIGYEAPWRQVEAMLLEAAARTPGLLRHPAPFVLLRGLETFAVNYEINVYSDNPHAMFRLYSALHRNILDLFNEYGVQIMTPAYEGDPDRPKVVPRDQWFAAPAKPDGRLPGAAGPGTSDADLTAADPTAGPHTLRSTPDNRGA